MTIAELRKERGLKTQEDLARKAGLSIATIKNIERGATTAVSSRTLRGLADALDVGIDVIDGAIPRKPARRATRARRRSTS